MFYGATHIDEERIHPVLGRDAAPCVTVGPGNWNEKIYHFSPDHPPSSAGDEIQSEFFVPYENFRECMEELFKISHHFAHLT
jgi:xylitol oxidase